MVAGAALSAVLALGSLPGLVGSRTPDPGLFVDSAAFQNFVTHATPDRWALSIDPLDAAGRGDGFVEADGAFIEPGDGWAAPPRPTVSQPPGRSSWAWKEPLYTLSGYATFYDHGTTAMRLPRGTRVVICGEGGCLERVVNDYGPIKEIRIVDMYRPDFFTICGCPSWSGTTWVTVRVY